MTQDALTQHRLKELEELAAGWRTAERRVDALGLSIAAVEKSVTAIETSLERNALSMARLHERLDMALTAIAEAQAREEGRNQAQAKTWKVIAWTVMAMIAFMGATVALLNLLLN